MMLRATSFEFRYRFWIISAIFALAFGLYEVDHVNAGEAIARWTMNRWVSRDFISMRHLCQAIFGVAVLFVAAAAMIRTWAAAYLLSDVIHDRNVRLDGLVADGPYRHLRNPLYLGAWLMSIGLGLLASRLGFGLLVVGIFVFGRRLIGLEEEKLSAAEGEPYQAYCAAVPRLWPSLRPRLLASSKSPRWGQAIVGEFMFWAFTAAALFFAITLNAMGFQIILFAGIAIHLSIIGIKRLAPRTGPISQSVS